MKKIDADEVIADFYNHLYKWDGNGKLSKQTAIHKLNFQILFNQSPAKQDWIDAMISFAFTTMEQQPATQMSEAYRETFTAIIDILRDHYNSLLPDNKHITGQMFEATLAKQQGGVKMSI